MGNWGAIEDEAFSSDDRRLATVDTHHIRCWDPSNGRQVWQIEGTGIHSLAWSPAGTVLAAGGDDHKVRLLDGATGKQTALLDGHTSPIMAVQFFPDGKRLASGGFDLTVRIWDVMTGRQIGSPLAHEVPVLSLAISPDSRELTAGLPLGKLAVWSLNGSKPLNRGEVPWSVRYQPWFAGQAPDIVYSLDGSFLGTAGPGGVFRAQHRTTGDLAFTLGGAGVDPMSAAWSPDGPERERGRSGGRGGGEVRAGRTRGNEDRAAPAVRSGGRVDTRRRTTSATRRGQRRRASVKASRQLRWRRKTPAPVPGPSSE